MSNVLEIKNLDLYFKEDDNNYQALYDINLNLEKGELHALVGESGCGKTMTAMSILRLLPKKAFIKKGSIIFNEMDLLNCKESEIRKIRGNKIVLIPQDPMTSLNPLYTVGNQLIETIMLHLKVNKHQAMRKAREVMDMVKIPKPEEKMNMYPHEFSGGMKQRIIIANALIGKPDLIIADEPTTALDVTIQKQIMDLLSEIKEEYSTTILLISHDLALVSNYADKITVMYSGKIVEQAASKEFFKNPIHPYSNALLNSLPSVKTAGKLNTITGFPPSIKENISGCKFYPRCKYFEESLCDKEIPQLSERGNNHYCACLKF